MKQLIAMGCGALALVAAGTASAADLPARIPGPPPQTPVFVAPVYNWTGFYIGINGGGASSHKCWDFLPGVGLPLREGCHNATGGAAGGQIGFNWQTGPVVFGVELSGDWTGLTGTSNSAIAAQIDRTKVQAIASATGRIGYAWSAALLYVKGGGAWVNDKYDIRPLGGGVVLASASETRTGWTAGAGFEYGFTPNWSVAVEYDHYGFGSKTVAFTGGFAAGNERIGQTVDMVTARLNWRFGGGNSVVARY